MALDSAVTTARLSKSYPGRTVLADLDLEVAEGSVFALLGPNGAGKTTTVKILSTLTRADGGTATVAGHDVTADPDGVRASIGVTGQFAALDELLTASENLRLMADLFHLDRPEGRRRQGELLEQFELTEAADRPVSTFSGGMKRRLDLAMTLMGRPKVIFLDEPTTGLDPRSRRDLWRIVTEQVAGGVTVLLTTQYLEEADALADRIALLDGGRLVAQGTPAELKRLIPGGHLEIVFTSPSALGTAAQEFPGSEQDPDALVLRVPVDGGLAQTRAVLSHLAEDDVETFTLHTPDLDDVFLSLTERETAR